MQMVLTVALYAFLSTPSHGGRLPASTDGSDPAKMPTQDASCEGKQQSADVLPLSGGRIAMTTISLVVFRGIEPRP